MGLGTKSTVPGALLRAFKPRGQSELVPGRESLRGTMARGGESLARGGGGGGSGKAMQPRQSLGK